MRPRSPVPLLVSLASLVLLGAAPSVAELPTPEEFAGHPVGADRRLVPYPKVVEYLRLVADASDRVSVETAGRSTLDNEMVTVVLTSAANQAALERTREIGRRLANPDRIAAGEVEALIGEGKVVALITCTIHSTEVGCTQMAMEFVHDFATTEDPRKKRWMEDVVLLLMPSINPDGQVMIVDWYEKHLGGEYEGGRMPWLYHHYVGHDNNRDFYMLTQKESRVVNEVLYHRWFPQVFLDEHQMGSTGPRMFVPPQTDPLAPEISSLIFRRADLIGTNMSYRLEEAGKTGVGHNMIYDSYWPGGTRNTAWWKNVTGLLTEVASARIATPIRIEPGELRGGYKGLPEYSRRSNFPSPWEGGWWRLRDIVEYELVATWALAETCSQYREEMLRNFYEMGRREVEAGSAGAPYGWVVPPDQHDPVAAARLVDLLLEHGVRVHAAAEPLTVGRVTWPAGTYVIPAAQPYRGFLLTMLRPQRYPEVRPYRGGPIFPPYDVTSWSLPISMGVEIEELARPLPATPPEITAPLWPGGAVAAAPGGYLLSHAHDTVYPAMNRLLAAKKKVYWLTGDAAPEGPGAVWVPASEASAEEMGEISSALHLPVRPLDAEPGGGRLRVAPVRVGLYKPWRASMDEGWTRWLLERYEFPYRNLANADLQKGALLGAIDVLLLPDVGKETLEKGEPGGERARFASRLPPDYQGGIGEEGAKKIREWVEKGGTLVALDSSTEYAIDLFELPVRNVLSGIDGDRFSCPGSMLRILVDTDHPLGYGLRAEEAAYFAGSPAFRTAVPDARLERKVVARYPDHRDDVLVSGYLKGAALLARRAAVVDFTVGKGRVVLIGFRAQHRAQPHRTFKLLFNALYLGGLAEEAS